MASEAGPEGDSQIAVPVYTRVTISGLALLAVAHLLLATTGWLFFAIVGLILSLLAAGLVWKYGRWALIVAVVLALLSAAVSSHVMDYGLESPDSFFDFVPSITAIAGFLMAFIGGIVAFVQQRRGSARTVATGVERGTFGSVMAALVVLTIMSVILTPLGRESLSAEERAGGTLVLMKNVRFERNVRFEPDRLFATTGSSLRLVVDNDDLVIHTFTIKDLDIDVTVGPKSETLVELPALRPGEYKITCEVPGHEEMKGTLVVSQ